MLSRDRRAIGCSLGKIWPVLDPHTHGAVIRRPVRCYLSASSASEAKANGERQPARIQATPKARWP